MKPLLSFFKRQGDLVAHNTAGGISPPSFKEHTLVSPIMPMPLPEELALSLVQNDGIELTLEVAVGDHVLKNQLLASPRSAYGVPVFAPTSGTVSAIENRLVANVYEVWHRHVIIQVDGNNTGSEAEKKAAPDALTPLELRNELQRLAVSGLGGADFPTAIKLFKASKEKSKLLIINGAECEPFISADEALLRERAAQVLKGAALLQKACEASDCVLVIEESKSDAINSLQSVADTLDIKLAILPEEYPAGGEKQVIHAVTGKEVPSGKLPADIGILVQNVGTAFAAYDAIFNGQPCISRITTLAGTPLKTPKNFEALLGTPIPYLLRLCGVNSLTHETTILGGSLMGLSLFSDDVATSRSSNCIIATSQEWFPDLEPEIACIRCGQCADVCPAKLLPQQLVAFSKTQDSENLHDQSLLDCIECGACSYVCPSKIPLVTYFQASKALLNQDAEQQQLSQHWQERYQYNQYRRKKLKEETLNRKRRLSTGPKEKTSESGFSRSKAKADIAAAVNRVKRRKAKNPAATSPEEHQGDVK